MDEEEVMDREREMDDERMYQTRPEQDMDADNSVPQYLTNEFSETSKCQCQQTLSGPWVKDTDLISLFIH